MNDEQLLRYSRQIMLPEIDTEGQARLLQSHVLIIGLGGLGSSVAYYLAAAGIGHLSLNDFDDVDFSNLQRQIVHNESRIGDNKAISAAKTLNALNSDITVDAYAGKLNSSELQSLAESADLIVDCSDNFTTRFLLNDISLACGIPLVSGAAIRHDGQVSVFNRKPESPCYRCLYPNDEAPEDQTCVNNGVIAPLVGIIGSIQANETIKVLLDIGNCLDGKLLLFDALNTDFRQIKLSKDPACRCTNPQQASA